MALEPFAGTLYTMKKNRLKDDQLFLAFMVCVGMVLEEVQTVWRTKKANSYQAGVLFDLLSEQFLSFLCHRR